MPGPDPRTAANPTGARPNPPAVRTRGAPAPPGRSRRTNGAKPPGSAQSHSGVRRLLRGLAADPRPRGEGADSYRSPGSGAGARSPAPEGEVPSVPDLRPRLRGRSPRGTRDVLG